ncbi:MAG: hypothetical protein VX874_15940 [Pseudomonadota bacterium]|nr:hypothetical protein [Pseudomonadota bacterium]
MTLSTATVTGTVLLPDDTALSTVDRIEFTLSGVETDTITILPETVSADVDENGDFSVSLWPNGSGSRGTSYAVAAVITENDGQYERKVQLGTVTVASATTYTLAELLDAS